MADLSRLTDPAGAAAILEVRDLKKHFPIRKGLLQRAAGHVFAVDGVRLTNTKPPQQSTPTG